jgi:S1-C subfamily serine protease
MPHRPSSRQGSSAALRPVAAWLDHREGPYALGVVVACVAVFLLVLRLTSGVSAADSSLEPVELRALAQQATLRLATGACGSVVRGSGFIVDEQLLTNAHLIGQADAVKADQPIDPVLTPMVALDSGSDLAAAVAPPAVSLVFATELARTGDAVVLAGHADGGAIEVRDGAIASRVPGQAYGFDSDVLLIDGTTRGGYSGGPVLDLSGRVVGMLSGFDRSTGLTIAVPSDVIIAFSAWARSQRSETWPAPDCG